LRKNKQTNDSVNRTLAITIGVDNYLFASVCLT